MYLDPGNVQTSTLFRWLRWLEADPSMFDFLMLTRVLAHLIFALFADQYDLNILNSRIHFIKFSDPVDFSTEELFKQFRRREFKFLYYSKCMRIWGGLFAYSCYCLSRPPPEVTCTVFPSLFLYLPLRAEY